MSKTAKNGRKCGAGLGEGIRGVWPAGKFREHRPRAETMPWVAPAIPDLPPLADRNAFEMHSRGMKQKEIAAQQHRSQPTVSRGISAVENWLAKTLPEDSGNLTAFERFRVGMVRHRIYLEHLKSVAEEEYERSKETLKIERVRTKTYPEGRKADGKPVTETTTDVYPKHQLGRVAYLHFIDKVERELAGLEAGWLGPGTDSISCDDPIDREERDRWDRQVKWQEAQIVELRAKLAAAEGKAELGAAPPSPVTEGAQPLTRALSQGQKGQETHPEHEYEISERSPDSGPKPPIVNDPTPVEPKACGETAAPEISCVQEASKVNKTPPAQSKLGWVATLAAGLLPLAGGKSASGSDPQIGLPGEQQPAQEIEQTPDGMWPLEKQTPEDPRPRWEDKYRQEALDYHCLIHGLPPASLEQATGIPDPKKISPRMWIEKGRPYMIHIDRSIPCDRTNPLDTRKVITLACPIAMQGPSMRVAGWPRMW